MFFPERTSSNCRKLVQSAAADVVSAEIHSWLEFVRIFLIRQAGVQVSIGFLRVLLFLHDISHGPGLQDIDSQEKKFYAAYQPASHRGIYHGTWDAVRDYAQQTEAGLSS